MSSSAILPTHGECLAPNEGGRGPAPENLPSVFLTDVTVLSAVSLLLCVAAVVLWERSYHAGEFFGWWSLLLNCR